MFGGFDILIDKRKVACCSTRGRQMETGKKNVKLLNFGEASITFTTMFYSE